MKNNNRLQLDGISPGGTDPAVDCKNCPAACCRKDMAIPLSSREATTLRQAGTQLLEMDSHDVSIRAPFGTKFFRLLTDCGNLSIDLTTGDTRCKVWQTDEYPRACDKFPMGGFNCVSTQMARITRGQDTHHVD
jgi:Fe-S-cluster containining protein